MANSDSTQQSDDLPGEFEIQQINNRVLGFPQETPPIITPQKERQILAFGTLEALLTSIQKYNDAYTAIQAVPPPNDADSFVSSLQNAGNDIKLIGSYLRCVGLLDETWQHSPGVQLLINPDAPLNPLAAAAVQKARKKREDKQKRAAEQSARKEAAYEFATRARREKLDKAIYEGIRIMMSYHRANKNRNKPGTQTTATSTSTLTIKNAAKAKDETKIPQIPDSSKLTTLLESGCEDAPSVPAKGNKENDTAATTSSESFATMTSVEDLDPEDVVVEAPNPEPVFSSTKTGVKRKAGGAPSRQAKHQPKRSRNV